MVGWTLHPVRRRRVPGAVALRTSLASVVGAARPRGPLEPPVLPSVSVVPHSLVRDSHLTLRANTRLFAVGIFANAALLFSVEPMFGKMVLPALGGGAMVWTTCLLFFQASLLVGYLYARVLDGVLAPRWQPVVHLALMVLAAAMLPVSIPAGWRPTNVAEPVWSLIALLAWRIGPPFVVLSAGAPLIQRWYAADAADMDARPYSLYAVSNIGSVGALLAYPFLIEPRLPLSTQASLWSAGYTALVLLIGVIALALRGNQRPLSARAGTRARPYAAATTGALGRVGRSSIEPASGCDHPSVDGPCSGAAAVGRAAGALSAHVRGRIRRERIRSRHHSRRPKARSLRRAWRGGASLSGQRGPGAARLRDPLRRTVRVRVGLSRASRGNETACGRAHVFLSLDRARRRDRRSVQRDPRTRALHRCGGVSDRSRRRSGAFGRVANDRPPA